MTIGARIKEQRKMQGLTQPQLAEFLNMSLDSIKKLETDRVKPSVDTLIKISTVLQCSTDYLLGQDTATVEAKKKMLREIMDSASELRLFLIEHEKGPPSEYVSKYLDSLAKYGFPNGINFSLFLKRPMQHLDFVYELVEQEFRNLDNNKGTP
jgi:transcriptional regulator with XRE-family HTH domain